MSQNSNNQDFSNDSDGFTLGGGDTERKLSVTGADVTLTGAGTNIYTMPSAADTLVGRASTDALTNKDISDSSNTFPDFVKGTPTLTVSATEPSSPSTGDLWVDTSG